MRAPRRRARCASKRLDPAQAGAAAQLPARDLLRGHGESLERVKRCPGSPSPPGAGRGRPEPPGVRPGLCAAARCREPALLQARLGRRTLPPALCGTPRRRPPCAHYGRGCVCSAAPALPPNPTGESRESELAPGS